MQAARECGWPVSDHNPASAVNDSNRQWKRERETNPQICWRQLRSLKAAPAVRNVSPLAFGRPGLHLRNLRGDPDSLHFVCGGFVHHHVPYVPVFHRARLKAFQPESESLSRKIITCLKVVWFLPRDGETRPGCYRPCASVTRTSGTTDNPNNFHSVPTRWNNISKPTGLGRIEKTPLVRRTLPCMAGAVE